MSSKIFEALKTIDYKDVSVRAIWTFVQAFLAVFLFTSDTIIESAFTGDWNGLYALLATTGVAGVAAGLSALKTLIISIVQDIKSKV
jgi:hypothetical protein